MSDLPTELPTYLPQKGSLISLKLGTLEIHDKWMCGILEFWWNNFLMGIKFDFKFEIWEKFYKGFPCKKKIVRILCKMSPNQNYREFFCKIFCWRSPINLKWNSFSKFKRNNFTNNFLVKKKYIVIIWKIIPEQK